MQSYAFNKLEIVLVFIKYTSIFFFKASDPTCQVFSYKVIQ